MVAEDAASPSRARGSARLDERISLRVHRIAAGTGPSKASLSRRISEIVSRHGWSVAMQKQGYRLG